MPARSAKSAKTVKPAKSHSISNLLKGIAITGVLLIHILAQLPSLVWYQPGWTQILAVAADQLSRICVPIFIALSGYGLTKKYAPESLEVPSFLWHRLSKLLPLYLIWSAIFLILLPMVPAWTSPAEAPHLGWILTLGIADYQLYFVPLIVQFYLVFPVLLGLLRRQPHLLLIGSLVVQVVIHLAFTRWIDQSVNPLKTFGDTFQYIAFYSWIFYFCLGMWLAQWQKSLPKFLPLVLGVGLIGGALWVIKDALAAIQGGQDALLAMRFTRLPVIAYTAVCVAFLFTSQFIFKIMPGFLKKILELLGKDSYLLFLSHTLFLRIAMSAIHQTVPLTHLAGITLLGMGAYWLSRRLSAF